jgi:TonB family protein
MKYSGLVLLLALATAANAAEPAPTSAPTSPPGYAFRPDPADYYPSASRAVGEGGVVKVRLCYDEKGKTIESALEESSGFSRLDEAAVRFGKAVRFNPGVVDGQPQSDCVVVPVRFYPGMHKESEDEDEGKSKAPPALPLPPVEVPPILKDIPLPPPPPRPIPLYPSPPVSPVPLSNDPDGRPDSGSGSK